MERLLQKGVAVFLMADGCAGAVPWMNDGGIGKLDNLFFQRVDEVIVRATPKIGAANASCKQRVARKQLRVAERAVAAVGWQKQRHATRCVPRRVHDPRQEISPVERIAF